jgi:hypothetical protein
MNLDWDIFLYSLSLSSLCVINPTGRSVHIKEQKRFFYFFFLLKLPKCEIFDRSDFHYFYTIKPFWVDDFVVKILTYYFNFWGSQASFSF